MEISINNPTEIATNYDPAIFLNIFAKGIIEKFKSGKILTDKGDRYSKDTIRSYNYFLSNWIDFEEETGIEYHFKMINPELVGEFIVALQKDEKSKNSISLILSKLKAIMKFAFKQGLTPWNGSGIKTPKELTTKIPLSFSDLKQLRTDKLTEGQQRVLDAFIIQTFTGLRIDTHNKFLKSPYSYIKEHEGKSYIDITSDKTGEQSIIPLGNTVINLLQKNKGKKLVFSEEYSNRTIKIIASKAELNNSIPTRITKGGILKEEFTPKNKLITTHTARRTLITLAKQTNMTDREIMGISGHKTEKQLNDYNRSTNLEKVKGILGNSFFDTEI